MSRYEKVVFQYLFMPGSGSGGQAPRRSRMASYRNSDSWPSNALLGSFGSLGGTGCRLGRPEGLYVIL
jgi:hypothetical protein